MEHKIKNIQLVDVTEDSGWIVRSSSRHHTEWMRILKTTRDPNEVASELLKLKDYPGWTGVLHAPGLAKNGNAVFLSVWDSSD